MGYAIAGKCDILADDEGTLAVLGWSTVGWLADELTACDSEGEYEVDGLRFCPAHTMTALDLCLIEDRYARVSYVGE